MKVGHGQEASSRSGVDMVEVAAHSDLLRILADQWSWEALLRLDSQPLRQAELIAALPPIASSTGNRRLHRLTSARLIAQVELRTQPVAVAYVLLEAGRAARPVRRVASIWERDGPQEFRRGSGGRETLLLLADEWVPPIMHGIAAGFHERSELLAAIPALADKTLGARLQRLEAAGVIVPTQRPGFSRLVDYALTRRGRNLATVAMLSSGWELLRGRPVRAALASDMAGYVRLIAPLVHVPPRSSGVCELIVHSSAAIESRLLIHAQAGAVTVLPPTERPRVAASAEGRPVDWYLSIMSGSPARLQLAGSRALIGELMRGLGKAACALWEQPPSDTR